MHMRRTLSALLLAVTISGGFTLWLGKKLSRQQHSANSTLHYVAARKSIDPGSVLTSDDLALVPWPETAPLPEALTRIEDALGKSVLYPLQQGEPIAIRDLSSKTGLSGHIPEGMRAISLKSNEVVGVAGYLLPGTHVDVLVTVRSATSSDPVTSTVLQDVQVLTAGEKMQPDPDGHASRVDVVTLLVSPEDAEKVVLSSTQGSIHFVLRNGEDHTVTERNPVNLASLSVLPGIANAITPVTKVSPHGRAPRLAAPTHTTSPYSIQVRRGDKDSVETF